ncbi:MAG: muramoyltetrapeptide carboxypeptidase [Noviherbaspirillum sp.]
MSAYPSGTGVAIVSPGGYAPDEAGLQRALERLVAQGCIVRNYYRHSARHYRFGATDEQRLAQLHEAARDPEVEVVIALRGGYGMSRLLPRLDFRLLAESGKLFVGHSDITALHMGILCRQGAVSFAGPMICDDFTREDASEFTMRHFRDCLNQAECELDAVLANTMPDNPALDCEGVLWGGNLSMLTHLMGTPYLPMIDGGVLFVEDVNEHPYRVERMLLQLLHGGILGRQKALVLGDFSSYRLSDYDNGYDFNAMLDWLRREVRIPVVCGLPFGHIRDKVTLPVGSVAHLQTEARSLRLRMRGYPFLT